MAIGHASCLNIRDDPGELRWVQSGGAKEVDDL